MCIVSALSVTSGSLIAQNPKRCLERQQDYDKPVANFGRRLNSVISPTLCSLQIVAASLIQQVKEGEGARIKMATVPCLAIGDKEEGSLMWPINRRHICNIQTVDSHTNSLSCKMTLP